MICLTTITLNVNLEKYVNSFDVIFWLADFTSVH